MCQQKSSIQIIVALYHIMTTIIVVDNNKKGEAIIMKFLNEDGRKIERMLIYDYVAPKYRERSLYELSHLKKREKFIHHLCHNYSNYLNNAKMHSVKKLSQKNIELILEERGCNFTSGYVICMEHIGYFNTLTEWNELFWNLGAVLIYFDVGIGYFHSEHEEGARDRYLLY